MITLPTQYYIFPKELPDDYVTYIAHVSVGDNQTLRLGFELTDESYDTNKWNIFVGVYSKRKHADRNEDNKLITGKNPTNTIIGGLQALAEIEVHISRDYPSKKNIFYCTWTDNTRRNAYAFLLKKRGYSFGQLFGMKVLMKVIEPKEKRTNKRRGRKK